MGKVVYVGWKTPKSRVEKYREHSFGVSRWHLTIVRRETGLEPTLCGLVPREPPRREVTIARSVDADGEGQAAPGLLDAVAGQPDRKGVCLRCLNASGRRFGELILQNLREANRGSEED